MLDNSPLNSFDHPTLQPSIAAREAVHEDAAPHTPPSTAGKSYFRIAPNRPAPARRTSSFSHTSDDASLHPGASEGDAGKKHDSRARASSSNGRGLHPTLLLMDETPVDPNDNLTTEVRAGLTQKSFTVHTNLLVSKSPYFAELQRPEIVTTTNSFQPTARLSGPFFFPELDEFAFALFVRWIYGGQLLGPHDFHTMNHYLCLYILARTFCIMELENGVMDLVRHYYRAEEMTSPAFRLQYIYTSTSEANFMREFLVTTAAFRALSYEEGKPVGLSESIKGLLRQGGDVAADYAEALCRLNNNGMDDVRTGDDGRWHVHNSAQKRSDSGTGPIWGDSLSSGNRRASED